MLAIGKDKEILLVVGPLSRVGVLAIGKNKYY